MNDSPPAKSEALSTTIKSVRTVLGFFTMIVLVVSGILFAMIVRNPQEATVPFYGMIVLVLGLAVMAAVVAVRWPDALGIHSRPTRAPLMAAQEDEAAPR